MAFEQTKSTWTQVANKQAYDEFTAGNLNSKTMITKYDPIYNKLVEQISYTMYRKLKVIQKWTALGRTAPENSYPGILREVYMSQRKGMNFPADNGERPTTLNCYEIFNDTIDVRYHSAQFRWMYPWTIFDEELRRFSGGNGTTIAELTEMKMINAINARNMFMDNLRKNTLYTMYNTYASEYKTGIDISDFKTLTKEQAQEWLGMIDNLIFELEVGTAKYNGTGNYIQTPKSDLQVIIPRDFYKNVMRRAFPETYHTEQFENILPVNLILIDTMGGDTLFNAESAEVAPTWDDHGMNLLNWTNENTVKPGDEKVQCVIMHRDCIGFEDNLNETLFGNKDIEKLATPVRSHFWTKAYFTDLLPAVKITKEA